jgi:uncharacterized protein YacL (UPF0231 family)
MDIAAFQATFPEEVRVQLGRTEWFGEDVQFYNAKSGTWYNLAQGEEAMMFPSKNMTFQTVEGLVKSSIVSDKEFAIVVDGELVGFVRGKELKTQEDEEMNVELNWWTKSEHETSNFEAPDMFSPEKDLNDLI